MRKLLAIASLLALFVAVAWLVRESRRPTGVILISIDTLRADHLGAYGFPLETSPFFDELAERGTLFEKAVVQLPGTLPSHMSIFTGLYPAQHGVYPPDKVLSTEIATLAERFRAAGHRTAGFTEGGYVKGHYGFERGFDVFSDVNPGKPEAAGKTFARAREWVDTLEPGDRFFLFVHTYEVHDPYDPPEPYRSNSWPGEPLDVWSPDGPNLTAASKGSLPVTPEMVEYFGALYDAEIRYVDDVLRGFFEHLWAVGLADDTMVVITSDHGEELMEHGSFVHRQIYDETLHVPLLFRRLGQRRGARVPTLVESVDLAPTLLDLAGIAYDSSSFSGESLVPFLDDPDRHAGSEGAEAFAEGVVRDSRAIYRQTDSGLYHLVLTRFNSGGGRLPVGRSLVFDWVEPRLEFRVRSYRQPRELTVDVDGNVLRVVSLDPGRDSEIDVELPPGVRKHRVRLSVPDCVTPPEGPIGRDCVGFLLAGVQPERRELFRLDEDPDERVDLSAMRSALVRDLEVALESYELEMTAAAGRQELTPEHVEQLKALGYLQ